MEAHPELEYSVKFITTTHIKAISKRVLLIRVSSRLQKNVLIHCQDAHECRTPDHNLQVVGDVATDGGMKLVSDLHHKNTHFRLPSR